MAAPDGYKALAKIGLSYKGDYKEGAEYKQLDTVYCNGSTYVALIDKPQGTPTSDGINWQYLAQGFANAVGEKLSDFTAEDTEGIIGEVGETVNAQELVTGIAKKDFERYYGIVNAVTNINKTDGVTTDIVEVGEGVTATTVFEKTTSGRVITTTIVPDEGNYQYVKTVTIETVDTGKKITETYKKEVK